MELDVSDFKCSGLLLMKGITALSVDVRYVIHDFSDFRGTTNHSCQVGEHPRNHHELPVHDLVVEKEGDNVSNGDHFVLN